MDKNKNLVLIDFETYNASLTFLNNRPWQVAMLKVKNDSIVDSLDKMIAWDCGFTISEEAKRITNFNKRKITLLYRNTRLYICNILLNCTSSFYISKI